MSYVSNELASYSFDDAAVSWPVSPVTPPAQPAAVSQQQRLVDEAGALLDRLIDMRHQITHGTPRATRWRRAKARANRRFYRRLYALEDVR